MMLLNLGLYPDEGLGGGTSGAGFKDYKQLFGDSSMFLWSVWTWLQACQTEQKWLGHKLKKINQTKNQTSFLVI